MSTGPSGVGHAAGGTPGVGPTVAWFHCFAGIAGDMALASLLDAGADVDELKLLLGRLPLGHWGLTVEEVTRGGVACTRVVVSTDDHATARTHEQLADLVRQARLPERVTQRSLATLAALARVEGAVHRRRPAEVHLHELGGHDTVVDVVGTAAALELLEVDEVTASAVATGTGTVRTAHGTVPNPSPAVVRLLEGAPAYGRPTPVELTTPTGAALLATLAVSFGPLPAMALGTTGFGAGSAELEDLPNCVQVVLGTALDASTADATGGGQPVLELETNVDDVTGEQLAHAVAALLEAGAHDAWLTPVVMKKGRPGHTVHALCDPDQAFRVRRVLAATTGTLGVRAVGGQRWPTARRTGEVEVEGESIRVKAGPVRAKPEFDDVARVARRTGLTVQDVAHRAEAAWREGERRPEPPGP